MSGRSDHISRPTGMQPTVALRMRLAGQCLAPRAGGEPLYIVSALLGVQAQDMKAAALALRVRGIGISAARLEATLTGERSIVRTWAMRRTLHLIPVEDLGWLLPVLAPRLLPAIARRSAELGMDQSYCDRAVSVIGEVLARDGPLTRPSLVEELAGKSIDASGQRAPALLCRAALEGLVCHGTGISAKPIYVLLSDWVSVGETMDMEPALAELARRYLQAFGPAEPQDFATWSGLPMTDAKMAWRLLEGRLSEFEVGGRKLWLLRELESRPSDRDSKAPPVVCLLPAFDTYLLGYRDRFLAVEPQHSQLINAGGGMVSPTIVVDGRVIGTWRYGRARGRARVEVSPFGALSPSARSGLDAEIAAVESFLGQAR